MEYGKNNGNNNNEDCFVLANNKNKYTWIEFLILLFLICVLILNMCESEAAMRQLFRL